MSQSGMPGPCIKPRVDLRKKKSNNSVFDSNVNEVVDPNIGVVKSIPMNPSKGALPSGVTKCVRPSVDKKGSRSKSAFDSNVNQVVDPIAKIEPESVPVLVKSQAQLDADRRGQLEDEAFEALERKREKRMVKENAWLIHVAEFRRQNPELGYRDMLREARKTYTPAPKPERISRAMSTEPEMRRPLTDSEVMMTEIKPQLDKRGQWLEFSRQYKEKNKERVERGEITPKMLLKEAGERWKILNAPQKS